jgi:CHAT domain-containing protein/tetratricopeptide (TPR) repeat protein
MDLTSHAKTGISKGWWAGGGILALCALTLFGFFLRLGPPASHAADLPPMRLTEGRLSGLTAYAPYPTPFDPRLSPWFHRASIPFHSMVVFLIRKDLDEAVVALKTAVRTSPGGALLLADLSAVYMERARLKNRPEDYVAALELAERAASVDPSLAQVVFNRAVALEKLFFVGAASEEWRTYLDLDATSPWADEARMHLQRLGVANRRRADFAPPQQVEGDSGLSTHAIAGTRASNEGPEIVETWNQRADALESLGQPGQAWRFRYQALAWSSQLPTGARQLSIALDTLEGAALAALAERQPEVALRFQGRAISVASALQRPERTVLALLTRARIEAALGRQEAAGRDFGEALKVLPHVQTSAREVLAARIDVVRSEIAGAVERAAAIAFERFVPQHLDQQADFDFRRGDTDAGEKTLEDLLEQLERRRALVPQGTYRVSFFDQARPLYERMVALQVHLAQPERALEVLERFRARALLEQMEEISAPKGRLPAGYAGAAPLGWRDLCRRIPNHTVLLVYAVVEGRLVTWLVQPSGVVLSPHQPDWASMASWIQRLRQPGAEETDRRALLKQLYEELVEPSKSELLEGDRIIFVPTRELYGVPFAALLDPISGRFLVQDHAVGVAPSASEFIAAIERDRQASARPPTRVLLVGDPILPMWLPRLQGSLQEIDLLSQIYGEIDIWVLIQKSATPRRVLELIGKSDIVHMAVHSMEDREDPTHSRLFLSSSGSDSGELTTSGLVGLHFPRTRLVMLAACGSHSGRVSESEGSLSLAYSFLAAGVPAVVGSLWQVDDQATTRLSVRFHQELRNGSDALTALRAAQLQEIAAQPALTNWTWASFQVYGGVEERVH